jgi:LysR family transcriptional activator of glutamate synthase operon
MELRHLRYFEAVARHSHVGRAAHELHIAQPSLSKQIHDLEHELGTLLFDRVGRGIELTDAGRVLLPYTRRILNEVNVAREALQQRHDLHRGRVRIGASPTVGTRLLPAALAAFNTTYPGIELEMEEAGVGRLLASLAEGTVQLAVASVPLADVTYVELFTEELVVAVGRQHALAMEQYVTTADLAAEAFILFPVGYELRERTLQLCAAVGFVPRIVLDGAEMDTVLRCAAVGLGIAIVPRLALDGADGLVGLPIHDMPLTRTLGLVWHQERQLSPAAEALRSFLLERLRM